MAFTGKENHDITLEEGKKYISNFNTKMAAANKTEFKKGGFFGKDAIEKLLAQDGAVGLRYYYGEDEDGNENLVLVAADADQNDMTQGLMIEKSRPCPPFCPESDITA